MSDVDQNATGMVDEAATKQDAPAENSSANVTTEVIKFRTYGAYTTDEKGNSVAVGVDDKGQPDKAKKPSTSRETKDNKQWEAQEKKSATILSENDYTFYNLTNENGLVDLVPDADQRLYIIQKGLDAIQTAAVNAHQSDTNEDGSVKYNGESIDLREAINEPPQRRVLTDEQKFIKSVTALPKDKVLEMLEKLKAQLAQG